MDKNEKLAVARKKLKKFQARSSPKPAREKTHDGGVVEGRATLVASLPPTSESPTPPKAKNSRISSSTQGLREISQEISSLLSQSTLPHPLTSATPTVHISSHNNQPDQNPSHGSLPGLSLFHDNLPGQTLSHSDLSPSHGSLPGHSLFHDYLPGSHGSRADSTPSHGSFPDQTLSHNGLPGHTPSRGGLLGAPSSTPQYPITLHAARESRQVPLTSTMAAPPLTSEPSSDTSTLEMQVQVHAQTIDILVGEKSDLQSQLTELQGQLRNKNREVSDLTSHLRATRQKLEEIEREKLVMSEEEAGREKALSQSVQECVALKQTVEHLKASLEEQRQESTELISKVTSQAADIQRLQSENTELQSRLNMAEVLTQQLSAGAPTDAPPTGHTPSQSEEEELRGELEVVRGSLHQVTGERNQALSDLTALREAMLHQQEEGARKLAESQGRLAESEVQLGSLSEQLAALQQERESIVARLSAEQAQLQQSSHVAMGTLHQERDKLKRDLQHQVQDNANLTRLNVAQEEHLASLEEQLGRLQEGTVDQQALLATISHDKETISRAVSQNKELKSQLGELQDAFVHLSQQNMELASDLQTERHRCGQLDRLLQETQDMHTDSRTHMEVEMAHRGAESALPHSASGSREQAQEVELAMQTTPPLPVVEPSTPAREPPASVGELEQPEQVERGEQGVEEDGGEAVGTTEESDFPGHEVSHLSAEELTTLQLNFNALQQRFMAVMSEKAELAERLQEREHIVMQLAGETETIGEYIALYQTQRDALRAKFQEKDAFIQHLVADRTSMKAKLHDLQALVRQLLAERRPSPSIHHHHHTSTQDTLHTSTQDILHTSTSNIPVHLRPQVYSHASPMEQDQPDSLAVGEEREEAGERGSGSRDTAEQIISLLGQLERGTRGEAPTMPCPCCTGQLIIV